MNEVKNNKNADPKKEAPMPSSDNHISRRRALIQSAGFIGFLIGSMFPLNRGAAQPIQPTPQQSLGPFFPDNGDEVDAIRELADPKIPISEANDQDLTFVKGRKGTAQGQIVYIRGRVLDAKTGQPIPNSTLIMWSASATGRYNHRGDDGTYSFPHPKTGVAIHRAHDEHFQYWGKAVTDEQGNYWFKTIVPGFYPIDLRRGIYRPSHLHFKILAPELPTLITQLYFRGDHIPNNDLNQELLPNDVVIRDAGLSSKEQQDVIVDYAPDATGKITDGLLGYYDFVIPS